MGGVNSICIGRKGPSKTPGNHVKDRGDDQRSSRNSFKGHRRQQSATFTQLTVHSEDTPKQNFHLVNINTATPEQLMTLPGVNRETANNIVDYRRCINGFRRLEDVALVPGVGGDRLSQIRPEICVREPQDSPDGPPPAIKKLNLNTANVFQLMKVNGITQTIAEKIVNHRERVGKFNSISDLRAIKCMDTSLLSTLKSRIAVDTTDVVNCNNNNKVLLRDSSFGCLTPRSHSALGPTSLYSQSQFSSSQLCLLTELRLFDQPYTRPPTTPFIGEVAGKSVIRIASWNLNRLGLDKIENPGVLEVICCTLLENALSFVALQEVSNPLVLSRICDELNNPSLPNVSRWAGSRGVWDFCASETAAGKLFQCSEYGAFIFNTKAAIELKKTAFLEKTMKTFTRNPFLGQFVLHNTDFLIASVHLKAPLMSSDDSSRTQTEIYSLPFLAAAMDAVSSPSVANGIQALPDNSQRHHIILGDFNLGPDHHSFDQLRTESTYSSLIDEFTNISKENPQGSCCYDNIWVSERTKRAFTGHAAVIRRGLSHPLIPVDFKFGGPVSDHCPVYAEFYVK